MSVLAEVESAVQAVAEKVGPAVVGIGRGWASGSGVVLAPGRVLTSAHNVRHEEIGVKFTDGRREEGRVTATDPDLDLAVIEVDTGEVEPVEWAGEDEAVALGRAVLALSNPGGRGLRVTPGFVST
jgi:serine protease Do